MSDKTKFSIVLKVSKLTDQAKLMYECDMLLRQFNYDKDAVLCKLELDDKNTVQRLDTNQKQMSEEEVDMSLELLRWNELRRAFLNEFYEYREIDG